MKKLNRITYVFVSFLIIFGMLLPHSALNARESKPVQEVSQENNPRTFALGISTFKEHGFGGIVRYRLDNIAFDGAVGFYPLIMVMQVQDYSGDTMSTEIEFGMPLHVNAGVVIYFDDKFKRFQNGLRCAYMINGGVGTGFQFGWVGELTWDYFALTFGAGIQYFPDFEDKVRDYFDISEDYEFSDVSTSMQMYLGVNFIFYVF